MKFIYSILLLSCVQVLLSCDGTEVGNGRSPPDKTAATSGTDRVPNQSKGEVFSEDPTMPEAASDSETIVPESHHLFAQCASPFAETSASAFTDSNGGEGLVITDVDTNLSIAHDNVATVVTQAATMASPYGISVTHEGAELECTNVETETNKRTVEFKDGYKVIWTLAGGQVMTIKIYNASETLIITYTKI